MKNLCGSDRVIGGQKLSVHAWKLNNQKPIKPDEILIRVLKIHLENGNFNQICMEVGGKEEQIKECILNIVKQRGKLHNPYTGTAGIIAGVVEKIGPACNNVNDIKLGDQVIIPVSASLIPLSLEKVCKVDYTYGHVDVEGYAILYDGCPMVKKQENLPWDLLMVAFEESASIENVSKLAKDKERIMIIGSNPIVATLYSLAVRDSMDPDGELVGVIYRDKVFDMFGGASQKRNKFLYSIFDEVYSMDSTSTLECIDGITFDGSRLFDVIVNCADQMGAEAVSVVATKEKGTVFFSNLSNNYTMALFIQEAINREMTLQCAAGYSSGYYKFMMDFIGANLNKIEELGKILDHIYRDRIDVKESPNGENEVHKSISDMMIYKSPRMKNLIDEVEKAAKYNCSVVIEGESGCGKEVLADLIRKMGDRNAAPYVKVNCAAIPKELMESEFFGYDKGAFTGAQSKGKKGFFELANGGILLLDEISEMPIGMQAKFLRAIQEGEFYRVGGQQAINVDVRVIATTNKDLNKMIKEGNFREDLFYRLAVVTLKIPPLRQRPEDIIPLAEFFVEKYSKKYGIERSITDEGKQCLLEYTWPGNVRELENTIQRLLINSHGKTISSSDILSEYNKIDMQGIILDDTDNLSYSERMNLFERNMLQTALQKYGSTYKASKHLKMTQSQFMRRKKKYGL
ncbi:MAG: sigma-54 interaction domain-containing protein [Anaerovoracaceae bacterium]